MRGIKKRIDEVGGGRALFRFNKRLKEEEGEDGGGRGVETIERWREMVEVMERENPLAIH